MANTYPKLPLRVSVPSNSFLSLIERSYPEGASQTFPVGAPLKLASGLALVFVNPTDASLAAFSLTAASGTTSAAVKVVLATPEIEIEANLLGSSAADQTLAAADLGKAYDLASNANLLGTGAAGWYIQATTSDTSVIINDFRSDITIPNQNASFPAVGDTNARVKARVRPTKSLWF